MNKLGIYSNKKEISDLVKVLDYENIVKNVLTNAFNAAQEAIAESGFTGEDATRLLNECINESDELKKMLEAQFKIVVAKQMIMESLIRKVNFILN